MEKAIILAPTDKVWFSVEDDMLIDSLGNISPHYVVSEDLMGFQDCFNADFMAMEPVLNS